MLDVIVVGAGVSGLAAAKKLRAEGLSVLILEARDRIGGRIYTSRSFGVPIDLGGSWVYDLEQNKLVQEFEPQFKLLPFGDLMSRLGEHILYGKNCEKIEGKKLDAVIKFVNDFFAYLVAQAPDKNLGEALKEFQYDSFSSDEILDLKRWLSNLLAFWTGAELSNTSVKVWQSMMDSEGGQAHYVLNGYDVMLNRLAEGLDITFQNLVEDVDFSETPVKVRTNRNTFEAKAVIITLPIGVLKSGQCHFTPRLPREKEMAIQAIGCGLLDKAILEFPHCFWDRQALSIQCVPSGQSPVQYYINFQALLNVPIVVAIYGGAAAEGMVKKSEAEQREDLLAPLREIYGARFVEPKAIQKTSWQEDPFARCSYAYLPRGQEANCFEHLSESIDARLFFAGEATNSRNHATAHGAYESGIRAATEILSVLTPVATMRR